MSTITKIAGLDPLISAARKKDWKGVLIAAEGIIRKYVGEAAADEFAAIVSIGEATGVIK